MRLNEVSSVPLQQAIRHQQAAYAAFFAKRARYPRFKAARYGRRVIIVDRRYPSSRAGSSQRFWFS